MTLFDINQAIMDAYAMALDEETGEILDEKAFESIDHLEMARENKIENIALYYKESLAEAEAIKAEKLAMAKRQKQAENRAESLKNYLNYALQGEKFKTARCAVSYRKSEEVEIRDVEKIPEAYLRFKPEPIKSDIKAAIKVGVEIPGAVLVSKQSVVVK